MRSAVGQEDRAAFRRTFGNTDFIFDAGTRYKVAEQMPDWQMMEDMIAVMHP